jgi:hypothetical protein
MDLLNAANAGESSLHRLYRHRVHSVSWLRGMALKCQLYDPHGSRYPGQPATS